MLKIEINVLKVRYHCVLWEITDDNRRSHKLAKHNRPRWHMWLAGSDRKKMKGLIISFVEKMHR
jgi:hypothetical protein